MKLAAITVLAANAVIVSASANHQARDLAVKAAQNQARALHQWDPKAAKHHHHSGKPSPSPSPTWGGSQADPYGNGIKGAWASDAVEWGGNLASGAADPWSTQPSEAGALGGASSGMQANASDSTDSDPGSLGGASSGQAWTNGASSSDPSTACTGSTADSSECWLLPPDESTPDGRSYASASARARIHKQPAQYALYGQAAANACGLGHQIQGAELTACPINGSSGWDCINLASTLESCGGCMSLGEGQDCTLITGADTVGCVRGKCVIGSCSKGYWLDSDKMACMSN